MGEEYRTLLDQALQQLEEHKVWLKAELIKAGDVQAWLVAEVESISVQLATVKRESDKPLVSVMWTYPDNLHAYLKRSDIPSTLQKALQGGITVEPKDTAVDTFPQTGKTRR
jgi:hypothetical protein